MTLRNITLIASILIAAVSCSMEDDLSNDVTKAINEAKGEAYISLNVNAPAATLTKATEFHATDSTVNHCSIILLDGGNVVTAIDDAVVRDFEGKKAVFASNGTDPIKFLVKVSKTYEVMIVANSTVAFEGTTYNTYAKIQAALQGANDLSSYAKVGKASVAVPANYEYASTSTTDAQMWANPVFVKVQLEQLSARIELAEFNVTGYTTGATPMNLTISKVELININTVSYTQLAAQAAGSTYTNDERNFSNLLVRSAGVASNQSSSYTFEGNRPVFYSFRNSDANNQVAMRIYFKLGNDEKVSRDLVINSGNIEPGYLYRIIVNSTITNDNVECSITCYTLDWLKNSYNTELVAL